MKIDTTLTANLQELYALEHTKKSSYAHIVPSLWGKRLYYSEAGWGKVLKIVYAVWEFFFGPDSIIKKIRQAIVYTEKAFDKQFVEMKKHFATYQFRFLKLLESQQSSDSKKYVKERWMICRWFDGTAPFIKLVQKGNPQKLDKLFKRFTGRPVTDEHSSFKNLKGYEEIKGYQDIINVSRMIPGKIPFTILKKLSETEFRLFEEEKKTLTTWISNIHSLGKAVKVNQFHKGMVALVKHINKMHCTEYMSKSRVDDLELELVKNGLNIFRQEDVNYKKWADSLNEGDELEVEGEKYTLGKELKTNKINNKMRVYTLQNFRDKLIAVGNNRVILSIKKRASEEISWGVRSIDWYDVSSDGRFAVIERLVVPFSGIQWKSVDSINIDDLRFLKPLVNQVKWFLEQNATPKNLNSSYLMYGRQRCLKSIKPLVEGEFNYPMLVDLCKECANENPVVYRYLVDETKLSKHPYQSYFKEVVVRTLEGKNDKAEDIGALHKFQIINYPVIQTAQNLQKDIIALQKKCMEKLLNQYELPNPLNVSKEVAQQIRKEYIRCQYICSLWPQMKKQVITTVVQNMNLSNKSSNHHWIPSAYDDLL
jgi:hypothetical protein